MEKETDRIYRSLLLVMWVDSILGETPKLQSMRDLREMRQKNDMDFASVPGACIVAEERAGEDQARHVFIFKHPNSHGVGPS